MDLLFDHIYGWATITEGCIYSIVSTIQSIAKKKLLSGRFIFYIGLFENHIGFEFPPITTKAVFSTGMRVRVFLRNVVFFMTKLPKVD